MSMRRLWRSPWLPFGCWILVIAGLSSVPDLGPPETGLPWFDKVCHFGEYGVLGLLFARAALPGTSPARAVYSGILLGSTVGSLDESYQRLIPGREVSFLDAMADTAGALAGTLAWRLTTAARQRARGR